MDGSRLPPRSPLAQPQIEFIWTEAAAAIGWRVERGSSAYASADGRGRIVIGLDESLDTDDAVAQLIFHELCHGAVEGGPACGSEPDWGLSNVDDRDVVREHACLRLQVHLAEPHGLRELMAPTTEYRAYHDDIFGDPLVNESDPAARLAREAVNRSGSRVWLQVLDRALRDTRARLDAWAAHDHIPEAAAVHPVGFPLATHQESCGTCAWRYRGGRGRPVERCRQSAGVDGNGRRTEARFRACVRWEPSVDCQTCGACCREAYHSVTVSVRDPVVWKRPALVVRHGHRFEIQRIGDRCAALQEEEVPDSSALDGLRRETSNPVATAAAAVPRAFFCRIYDDRPRACREFESGGRHCLVARRRVGLTP